MHVLLLSFCYYRDPESDWGLGACFFVLDHPHEHESVPRTCLDEGHGYPLHLPFICPSSGRAAVVFEVCLIPCQGDTKRGMCQDLPSDPKTPWMN